MITRYTAVTAPFLATAIAAALVQLPRVAGALMAGAAVVVSVGGLVDNHSPSGYWAPVKAAVEYVAPRERHGDFMLDTGAPIADVPLFYYVTHTRLLRPKLQLLPVEDPAVPDAFRHHERVWIVDKPRSPTSAAALRSVQGLLRKYHFHAVIVRVYDTSLALGLLLTVPDATDGSSSVAAGFSPDWGPSAESTVRGPSSGDAASSVPFGLKARASGPLPPVPNGEPGAGVRTLEAAAEGTQTGPSARAPRAAPTNHSA